MTDATWTWAMLDRRGVDAVREAEATLGADVVLVYSEGAPDADGTARAGLAPAPLTPSELECLQGLERQLGGVAVAYRRVA